MSAVSNAVSFLLGHAKALSPQHSDDVDDLLEGISKENFNAQLQAAEAFAAKNAAAQTALLAQEAQEAQKPEPAAAEADK